MKTLSAKSKVEAFTLIELLAAIAIIAILAALFLPTHGGRGSASRFVCAYNLNTIGNNFTLWSQEHEGKLPMQVSITNGGSMEFIAGGSAVIHFQMLTNSGLELVQSGVTTFTRDGKNVNQLYAITNRGLKAELLVCPSDTTRRDAMYHPKSIADMADTNISYFVRLDASLSNSNSILAGDRHLRAGGEPVKPGLFAVTPGLSLGWTKELHPSVQKGNILFVDGHVEFSRKPSVAFQKQGLGANRLAVP
jgi:prepilin-type N-terminal cleavage/methylation domain-containing protein/prepilin-type processing-associated H-X9-DG protein